jgi:imidazolonepropionase-like amidohydrolase
VKIAFQTNDSAYSRNLPYHAGMAAAFGLPKEEALKAVTIYPAEIFGIADRVGSIEQGKIANLIVTDGDPLEIRTQIKHVFINGRDIPLTSRHTELYEKYKARP